MIIVIVTDMRHPVSGGCLQKLFCCCKNFLVAEIIFSLWKLPFFWQKVFFLFAGILLLLAVLQSFFKKILMKLILAKDKRPLNCTAKFSYITNV